jgi:hypothetical protein
LPEGVDLGGFAEKSMATDIGLVVFVSRGSRDAARQIVLLKDSRFPVCLFEFPGSGKARRAGPDYCDFLPFL